MSASRPAKDRIVCILVHRIKVDPVEGIERIQPQVQINALYDRNRFHKAKIRLREAGIAKLAVNSFVALLTECRKCKWTAIVEVRPGSAAAAWKYAVDERITAL